MKGRSGENQQYGTYFGFGSGPSGRESIPANGRRGLLNIVCRVVAVPYRRTRSFAVFPMLLEPHPCCALTRIHATRIRIGRFCIKAPTPPCTLKAKTF